MLEKDLSHFAPRDIGQIVRENSKKEDSYFVPVFNFMYYLLVCPFKVARNSLSGGAELPAIGKKPSITSSSSSYYTLKSHKVQKLGCIIIHIAAFLQTFPFMYNYKDTFNSVDVSLLFDAVGNIASGAALLVFLKIMWLDQRKILDFLNASRIGRGLSERNMVIMIWIICLHTYGSQLGFACWVMFHFDVAQEFVTWIISIFPYKEQTDTTTNSLVEITKWIVHKILVVIINQSTCMYSMSRMIVMIFATILLPLSTMWERFLEGESCVKKAVEMYNFLKGIVGKGNEWIGWLLLVHYVGLLTFMAYIPAVRSTDVTSLFLCYIYIIYGVFLIIACSTTDKVRISWRRWASKKRLQIGLSNEERFLMASLSQEIESEPLGLSCAFFTLTYSFLGSMVGLVTTYGILVYQMRNDNQSTSMINNFISSNMSNHLSSSG